MSSELAGATGHLEGAQTELTYSRLRWLADQGLGAVDRLPHTVKLLLENLLRRAGTRDTPDQRQNDKLLRLQRAGHSLWTG